MILLIGPGRFLKNILGEGISTLRIKNDPPKIIFITFPVKTQIENIGGWVDFSPSQVLEASRGLVTNYNICYCPYRDRTMDDKWIFLKISAFNYFLCGGDVILNPLQIPAFYKILQFYKCTRYYFFLHKKYCFDLGY